MQYLLKMRQLLDEKRIEKNWYNKINISEFIYHFSIMKVLLLRGFKKDCIMDKNASEII